VLMKFGSEGSPLHNLDSKAIHVGDRMELVWLGKIR